jgi:thiamine-phosphate pyrophosphorylase
VTAPVQLYLTFEAGGASPEADAARLQAVLKATAVASALIRPAAGTALDARTVATLVLVLQKHGIAALVADDAALAKAIKADGIHLTWSKDIVARFADARRALGPTAIIGADAGRSRHDAMELGEANADYVAFGIPPHVEDRAKAEERQCDLIAWWSEIFEIPCVAFDVADADQAKAVANTGADFVTVTVSANMAQAGAAAAVKAIAHAVSEYRVTA